MRPALIALCVVLGSLQASADAIGQGSRPAGGATTPTEKLQLARDLFKAKDYVTASEKLGGLLYPTLQLAQPSDLVEAHLLLGVCFVETGRPGEAKDEFKEVLRLEPDKIVDSTLFSARAIRIFDETKFEVEEEKRKLEGERKIEELKKQQEEYLKSTRTIETHTYFLNYLPFGAGQFQEHRNVRGIVFASTETVTLGVSMGIWLYLAGKYGIVSNNVPAQDVSTVRGLQGLEIVSGGAFFVTYGLGVIDALLHYQQHVEIKGDESLLPPELRPPPRPKKTSLRDRIHVFPMPTAHGGGIGIGWEN